MGLGDIQICKKKLSNFHIIKVIICIDRPVAEYGFKKIVIINEYECSKKDMNKRRKRTAPT